MEEVSKSLYNEASLKMNRLDKSQSRISEASLSPMQFNHSINKFGYEIVITELMNLLSEVWGKLSKDDKKKVVKMRSVLFDMIELKPVHQNIAQNNFNGSKPIKRFNYDNWIILREYLFLFHMEINELLEKAGYSTWSDEDDPDDPYN